MEKVTQIIKKLFDDEQKIIQKNKEEEAKNKPKLETASEAIRRIDTQEEPGIKWTSNWPESLRKAISVSLQVIGYEKHEETWNLKNIVCRNPGLYCADMQTICWLLKEGNPREMEHLDIICKDKSFRPQQMEKESITAAKLC